MKSLELQDIEVTLHGKTLLAGVSLTLGGGELLGLIGPNGAGKSTLLKAVAHLLSYRGSARLDDASLAALTARERARRVAYLAQAEQAGWPLQVRHYVELGRIPHRTAFRSSQPEDRRAVDRALEWMALGALAHRRFDELSGGERARARLARALAVDASLLLADEPVAALDPYHQLNVMELLRRQCRDGRSAVVVLHDLTLASRFCDRILLLDHGRPVACGSPRQVLTPKHLQQVYKVHAVLGEHQAQPYVMPWSVREHP